MIINDRDEKITTIMMSYN